jgi:hypothetical protein
MEQRWSVPENILAAKLQDEVVLLHLGTKDYFRLNETASVAWHGFERRCTEAEIVDLLCEAFTIERAAAEAALRTLIADLEGRALIARAVGPEPDTGASA